MHLHEMKGHVTSVFHDAGRRIIVQSPFPYLLNEHEILFQLYPFMFLLLFHPCLCFEQ